MGYLTWVVRASKRGVFDDPTDEINEVTALFKTNLRRLGEHLSSLSALTAQETAGAPQVLNFKYKQSGMFHALRDLSGFPFYCRLAASASLPNRHRSLAQKVSKTD